jgi:phosphoglycerate dehydrogenase-like enzyme
MSSGPMKILMSRIALEEIGPAMSARIGADTWQPVLVGEASMAQQQQADLAFISRDVTGRSTKYELSDSLKAFYDVLRAAPALRWVHVHSAGADRPIFGELRARGVTVTTSSGANAPIVAQTAIAGILALTRRFPQLMDAQRERRWAPLYGDVMPPDLAGQTAVVVGWGPAGQRIGELMQVLGVKLIVVRHREEPVSPEVPTFTYAQMAQTLPAADWLVLVCPLSELTRQLVDAPMLAHLPRGAQLINVARGEVVDEPALIAALQSGHLGGAYLDVFAHEPLDATSPLWALPNVILTPHAAGHSAGNFARVAQIFIDNLGAWVEGGSLRNRVA